MTVYFFDSSALVKRHVDEVGSEWVRMVVHPKAENVLTVARITWVEILSAFGRLKRENKLTTSETYETVRIFQYDWKMNCQVVELDLSLAEDAGRLVEKIPIARI